MANGLGSCCYGYVAPEERVDVPLEVLLILTTTGAKWRKWNNVGTTLYPFSWHIFCLNRTCHMFISMGCAYCVVAVPISFGINKVQYCISIIFFSSWVDVARTDIWHTHCLSCSAWWFPRTLLSINVIGSVSSSWYVIPEGGCYAHEGVQACMQGEWLSYCVLMGGSGWVGGLGYLVAYLQMPKVFWMRPALSLPLSQWVRSWAPVGFTLTVLHGREHGTSMLSQRDRGVAGWVI